MQKKEREKQQMFDKWSRKRATVITSGGKKQQFSFVSFLINMFIRINIHRFIIKILFFEKVWI